MIKSHILKCKHHEDQDTWLSKEPITTEPYGFIYLIHDLANNRYYIGSKAFKKTVKAHVKSQKRKKTYIRQTNWKSYYGSSKYLDAAIEQHGKENFKRYLISTWNSKRALINEECSLQWKLSVLTLQKPNGIYWFYNIFIDKTYRHSVHTQELKTKGQNHV